MRPTRDILTDLFGTGLSPDQMALVAELSAAIASDASGKQSKHAAAQARYHARKRGDDDHLISSDHNDQPNPPPAYTTPPVKKPKKVSLHASTSEIPENPSENAREFAEKQGWDTSRIALEWQRFRDHSLSKGKKHRDILAAWRNWVRSPYQANGTSNGLRSSGPPADKSVSAAAGRILERLRDLDKPISEH